MWIWIIGIYFGIGIIVASARLWSFRRIAELYDWYDVVLGWVLLAILWIPVIICWIIEPLIKRDK